MFSGKTGANLISANEMFQRAGAWIKKALFLDPARPHLFLKKILVCYKIKYKKKQNLKELKREKKFRKKYQRKKKVVISNFFQYSRI